jgi:hypothetical protein
MELLRRVDYAQQQLSVRLSGQFNKLAGKAEVLKNTIKTICYVELRL